MRGMANFLFDCSPRRTAGDSCFIGARRIGHGRSRSYRLSTGVHHAPDGKDVLRGVDVSVIQDTAVWAHALPRVQRQKIEHTPTDMTAPGTGIPPVKADQRAPVPHR